MLNLYLREDGIPEVDTIVDVERAFEEVVLTGSPEEHRMLEEIEHAKYKDSHHFIDRFGNTLYISNLSTGCKAALVVIHNPEKLVDLRECGWNARDAVFTLQRGNVLVSDPSDTINSMRFCREVSVQIDGFVFTDLARLDYYLGSERPYRPNMEMEGVCSVEDFCGR